MSYVLSCQILNTGNDVVKGGATGEYPLDAHCIQFGDILLGDNAAHRKGDIVNTLDFHFLQQILANGQMGTRHDAETDDINRFLHCRPDDLLNRLVQPGVNNLHTGIS